MTGVDMHVEAWIDGEKVTDHQIPPGTAGFAPTGLIGLQVHGNRNDPPGTVAKFKNVRIRELPVFDTAEFSLRRERRHDSDRGGDDAADGSSSGTASETKEAMAASHLDNQGFFVLPTSDFARLAEGGVLSTRRGLRELRAAGRLPVSRDRARTAASSCARSGTARTPRSRGARSRSSTTTTGSACTRASSSPGSIAAASTGRRRRG